LKAISKVCDQAHVPIFSSEASLVARGAVAAHGADFCDWEQRAGGLAARLLEKGDSAGMQLERVVVRKHAFNPQSAARFGIQILTNLEPVSLP
jgi:putative ABC transport system substrate-binding protein